MLDPLKHPKGHIWIQKRVPVIKVVYHGMAKMLVVPQKTTRQLTPLITDHIVAIFLDK